MWACLCVQAETIYDEDSDGEDAINNNHDNNDSDDNDDSNDNDDSDDSD